MINYTNNNSSNNTEEIGDTIDTEDITMRYSRLNSYTLNRGENELPNSITTPRHLHTIDNHDLESLQGQIEDMYGYINDTIMNDELDPQEPNMNEDSEQLLDKIMNETNETNKTTLMINLFDSNTTNKLYLFIAQGWFLKDTKLKQTMEKHSSLATCVYCVNNINNNNVRVFKNLPYKKCKINNIQTNNLFCVCQECYSCVELNNIVTPPSHLEDIKKIVFSKYGDILEYNHYLLYQKHNISSKQKLDTLKIEYDKLVKVNNYFQNTNKLLKNSIDFEKTKHKYLTKIRKNNMAAVTKLSKDSITNFQKLYSTQIKNVENLCDQLESVCDTEKEKTVECKICMSKNIELAMPCGHTCCFVCIEKIRTTNYDADFDIWDNEDVSMKKCPICRANIDLNNVLPIYF